MFKINIGHIIVVFTSLLFLYLYWDSHWSDNAKKCFEQGGDRYDATTGCTVTKRVGK